MSVNNVLWILASPVIGILLLLGSMLSPRQLSEKSISFLVKGLYTLNFLSVLVLLGHFLLGQQGSYELPWLELHQTGDVHFHIIFYVDAMTLVFLLLTAFVANIIAHYCRRYLHREVGYHRFFLTFFSCIFGMDLLLLAGSLDVLFAGWDLMGLASFILICFYSFRHQTVDHALRIYAIYRFCDVGVLIGGLLTVLLWKESSHFSHFIDGSEVIVSLSQLALWQQVLIAFLLIIAAAGKSAQFPFCTWIPKAMEGPTPSSALFYGALSIHAGVYLILRTYSIWSMVPGMSALVFAMGLISSIVAAFAGRVQANVKSQIGYAAIAQVGVMWMEIAVGLPQPFILLHVLSHAMLRCYQLLVSPSIVVEQLKIQAALGSLRLSSPWSIERFFPVSWRKTLYVFAINECYVDRLIELFIILPLRRASSWLNVSFSNSLFYSIWTGLAIGGIFFQLEESFAEPLPPNNLLEYLPWLSLLLALVAFSEKVSAQRTLFAIVLSSLFTELFAVSDAISLGDLLKWHGLWLLISYGLSAWLVFWLQRLWGRLNLRHYYGFSELAPRASAIFLFCMLGMMCFPATAAFVGEDLLYHSMISHHPYMTVLMCLVFILNGITSIRLYAHLFLGKAVQVPSGLSLDLPRRYAWGYASLWLGIHIWLLGT